jgi:hypothetical protein
VKKTGNNATYYFKSIENSASALRIARAIFAVKENFTSVIFRLLKAQNEKLEIIYANIRV